MKRALIGYGGHAREVLSQMGGDLVCLVDEQYVVGGPVPSMNELSSFVTKNKVEYKTFMELIDYVKNRLDVTQLAPNAKTELQLMLEESRRQGLTLPPSTAPMVNYSDADQDRMHSGRY
jgi:hypothetical protein